MKLWGGRFDQGTSQIVEDFNESLSVDKRLYAEDIDGSIAHTQMLFEIKVLTKDEKDQMITGLKKLKELIQTDDYSFDKADEDIHMSIEKALTTLIGPVAKKMHTARSRNDQVALDIRLYLKKHLSKMIGKIDELLETLLTLALKHVDTIMPGYTHLQRAQPVSLGYYLMAYYEKFARDKKRFKKTLESTNIMPLGVGALAGVNYKNDRELLKEYLNFDGISMNGLDAVSDRDFAIEYLSDASIVMMHLTRMCEELILWSSTEFRFISMSDDFCTGSSIMPQKKNPDVPELIRGKSGRVYGNLFALLTVMKSLPLAYNKDMQEDKEIIFDTVDTIEQVLSIMKPLLESITWHKEPMKKACVSGFLNATEVADYLVTKGLAFREAHEISGTLVSYCIKQEMTLLEVPLNVYKEYCSLFEKDIYQKIAIENSLNNKKSMGSTNPSILEEYIKYQKKQY